MVVNKRNLVYCGRGSIFGNPFKIGRDGTREEVIEKFKDYFFKKLTTDSNFRKEVHKLKGKILVCFCKPLPCHADIIEKYLNKGLLGFDNSDE